jgi:hypothetical protein
MLLVKRKSLTKIVRHSVLAGAGLEDVFLNKVYKQSTSGISIWGKNKGHQISLMPL